MFLPDPTQACYGSGRQGRSSTGESPVVSITRFGHEAIPQFMRGNPMFIAWRKRPGCSVDSSGGHPARMLKGDREVALKQPNPPC